MNKLKDVSFRLKLFVERCLKESESEVPQSCLTLCNPVDRGAYRPFPSPGDLPDPGLEFGSPTL